MMNFSLLYNIRWQDLLDIIILTVIFYRMIIMVQGTKTLQIATGLSIVGLTYYVATALELYGISWLLTNLFNSIVIVLIILFQTDFRNALANMATKRFFYHEHNATSGITEKVMDACEVFSRSKIGALIVFEGDVSLSSYIATGVPLHACFSTQLLASIFHVHSPLHDGAVIINQSGEIQTAGCILPLTAQVDIEKRLGTRHRAAIGLSEETDAVIIVVSEETGSISLAHKGEMQKNFQWVSLREKLNQLLPQFSKKIKKSVKRVNK